MPHKRPLKAGEVRRYTSKSTGKVYELRMVESGHKKTAAKKPRKKAATKKHHKPTTAKHHKAGSKKHKTSAKGKTSRRKRSSSARQLSMF